MMLGFRHGLGIVAIWIGICIGQATAQEDRRLPVVEELARPRVETELLDLSPRTITDSRRLPAEDTARMHRINTMLRELKILAKERKEANRRHTTLPVSEFPVPPKMQRSAANALPAVPPSYETVSAPKPAATVTVKPTPRAREETPISLTSTVDSLALANNLFAQGKVSMAQPIYEKLLTYPQPPTDLVWIQYQLACCNRIDGRIKEATKIYRIVSSSDVEPYWASRAQWWLNFLGRAQRLDEQRQKLEKQLELLKKAANAPQNK